MSRRLYEGESVEIYDPHNGFKKDLLKDTLLYSEEDEAVVLSRAREAEELLRSKGWKLLQGDIESAVKEYTQALINTSDPLKSERYRAAIRVYESFEGFINRYIYEGKLAMDNQQVNSEE